MEAVSKTAGELRGQFVGLSSTFYVGECSCGAVGFTAALSTIQRFMNRVQKGYRSLNEVYFERLIHQRVLWNTQNPKRIGVESASRSFGMEESTVQLRLSAWLGAAFCSDVV